MPCGQLRRHKPFGVERAQQLKRPASAFILDVGHEVGGEEPRAGHLGQLEERAEQARLATGKDEAVARGRRVLRAGQRKQIVPRGGRLGDEVCAKVQQAHVYVARDAVERAIDAREFQQERNEICERGRLDQIVERREKA